MASREKLLNDLIKSYGLSPINVLLSDLPKLHVEDLREGIELQPCVRVDRVHVPGLGMVWRGIPAIYGTLRRGTDTALTIWMSEVFDPEDWQSPISVAHYSELFVAAVRQRERTRQDVQLLELEDNDGGVVSLSYEITFDHNDLRAAVDYAKLVQSELFEIAEAVAAAADDAVAAAKKRLNGWGQAPLEDLVEQMRRGSHDEKGRTLEELTSRLFNTVPGFVATGRIITKTEEIDIRIQNASDDEVWRRESALLIAECKNWSTQCGHPEFALFKEKLRNRVGRVSCGFLISWNGFAETVTKDMLRGSEGDLLVVPIDGAELRAAVREDSFALRLKTLYERAVFL